MTGTNQESFDKLKIRVLMIIVLAMGVVMAGHYFGYFFEEHKNDAVVLAELEVQKYEMEMGMLGSEAGGSSPEFDEGYNRGFDDGYMQGYNDFMMTQQEPAPE